MPDEFTKGDIVNVKGLDHEAKVLVVSDDGLLLTVSSNGATLHVSADNARRIDPTDQNPT